MHNNVSGRNFMNAETAKFTGAVLLVTEIYALLASLVTGLEYIFAMMFLKLFVLVAVLDILYVFVKTKWLKHAKIKVFSENTVVMAFAVISSAAYSWNMLLESSTLYLQLNKPATLFTGYCTLAIYWVLLFVVFVGFWKALLFFRNKKKASHS